MNAYTATVLRGDLREFFRAGRGPGVQGLRRAGTGPTSCSPRAGTRSTRCCGSTSAARAPTSCRTTSPSSSPPRPRRCGRAQTYTAGLYWITAGPWLRDLLATRYGAGASSLRPRRRPRRLPPAHRRAPRGHDRLLRPPRHAAARRPARASRRSPRCSAGAPARASCCSATRSMDLPFAHEQLGVATPEELSWAYSEATVGLSLSLTNYSLIPQEMMACGLPLVELAGDNIERVFGADGPVALAPPDPIELADALHARCSTTRRCASAARRAGRAFVADRTWDDAAAQLEAGLRAALRERARGAGARRPPRARRRRRAPGIARADARARPRRAAAAPRRRPSSSSRASPTRTSRRSRPRSATSAAPGAGDRSTKKQLALVFGVWHEIPAVLEKTGLRPDAPPEDVHAMARGPLAAGGAIYYADLLGTRWPASAPTWPASSAGWTSAAPPGASSAGSRPRGRRRSGTAATPTAGDRVGARAPAGDRVPAVAAGPAAALRRRRVRLRLRDLDLVALRRARGDRAGWRRCTASSAPAGGSSSPRTACSRSPTTRTPASGRPCSSSGSVPRCTARASGSPTNSARRATGACATRAGARPSSRPSGCRARVPAAGWSRTSAVGTNADNQDLYVLRRR